MNYYGTELIESFNVIDEIEVFNNQSIQSDLELADYIVMHRWLFNYFILHKDVLMNNHLYLKEDIVLNKAKDDYIQSFIIETYGNYIYHPINNDYYLHRLILLHNNRICLISKGNKDYKFDIFVKLNVDRIYETDETIRWLNYKLAFENSPVRFANEIDYFKIEI